MGNRLSWTLNEIFFIKKKYKHGKALVDYSCNPSFSRSWDQEDCCLRPTWANSSCDLIPKIPKSKKGWRMAQVGEYLHSKHETLFKPSYQKKKKKYKHGTWFMDSAPGALRRWCVCEQSMPRKGGIQLCVYVCILSQESCYYYYYFAVLGLELKAYTSTHSTSPFCDGFFQDRAS
jgi:hypothetical protein